MAAGSTYTPIATTTLGSSAASYTFSSISGSYTDIVLVVNGTNTATDQALAVQVGNGSVDTGLNYSSNYVYGNGSTAGAGRSFNDAYALAGRMDGSNSTSIVNFMNYSNTSTYKTILGRGNDGTFAIQHVALWRSTAAINTIKVYNLSSVDFASGTSLTLYGIQAA